MEKNPTWTLVVALALSDEDGRWLMHQRPLHKQHGGLWEFPGGKVESGEKPADALVREAAEELGIALRAEHLSPACFAQSDGPNPIVILLYTARDWEGEPLALEGGKVGWFVPEDALLLDRPLLDIALMESLFGEEPV